MEFGPVNYKRDLILKNDPFGLDTAFLRKNRFYSLINLIDNYFFSIFGQEIFKIRKLYVLGHGMSWTVLGCPMT
jgi:hypothetical protein